MSVRRSCGMHDWLSRVYGVGRAGVKDNTRQRRGEALARVHREKRYSFITLMPCNLLSLIGSAALLALWADRGTPFVANLENARGFDVRRLATSI
jgi:hypothetical protein